jgi:hypothetical protein
MRVVGKAARVHGWELGELLAQFADVATEIARSEELTIRVVHVYGLTETLRPAHGGHVADDWDAP